MFLLSTLFCLGWKCRKRHRGCFSWGNSWRRRTTTGIRSLCSTTTWRWVITFFSSPFILFLLLSFLFCSPTKNWLPWFSLTGQRSHPVVRQKAALRLVSESELTRQRWARSSREKWEEKSKGGGLWCCQPTHKDQRGGGLQGRQYWRLVWSQGGENHLQRWELRVRQIDLPRQVIIVESF